MIVALILAVLLAAAYGYRVWRIRTLRWPYKLPHLRIADRTVAYLRRRGIPAKTWPSDNFHGAVEDPGMPIILSCRGGNDWLGELIFKDLADERNLVARDRTCVVVTTHPVTVDLRSFGRRYWVPVIHVTELPALADFLLTRPANFRQAIADRYLGGGDRIASPETPG